MMKLIYAETALNEIRRMHPAIRLEVRRVLETLQDNAHAGKPLQNELMGYHSLAYKRYRIIYKITAASREIHIYTIGHRSDVYEKFSQFVKQPRL